jgi:hypothetical protein
VNWRAFIYPLFHGYPRVIIVNRAQMRYEEEDRFVPFTGEAYHDGFAFNADSIEEWHSKQGITPISVDERNKIVTKITEEIRAPWL